MIRGGQVLTEIGIDRWRLRRAAQAPAVQLEVESRDPEPITDQFPKEIVQSETETELDWQIVIRNYRTLATLQLVRQVQDAPLSPALNQLSDDIGFAINGLATKPLVQSQLFSTRNERVIDTAKVATWVADLPNTVLLLAGQCSELIRLIEQVGAERVQGGFIIIEVPDLLDPATAVERKAQLWQQLSMRKS